MMSFCAVWTGLEPATSGVTGRHSNQLNYQTSLDSFSLILCHNFRLKLPASLC